VDYEKYILALFAKPLALMRKLNLTEDELLKLETIDNWFDLQTLTQLMFDRYAKKENTSFEFKDNILWVNCPYESEEFKTEIIRYLSNFPTYEIRFINNGYNN